MVNSETGEVFESDPRSMEIEIRHEKTFSDEEREPEIQRIPGVPCSRYEDVLKDTFEQEGNKDSEEILKTFTCPDLGFFADRKVASGYILSEVKETTFIEIKSCQGSDCASNIDQLINSLDVQVVFINANFDPKNMKQPVSFYFDLRLNQQLIGNLMKSSVVNIMQQKAILNDDYLGGTSKTKYFYQVNEIE